MSVRLPPDVTLNSRVVPPPLRVASVTPRIVTAFVMTRVEVKVMTFEVATSMTNLPSSIAELSSSNEVTENGVVGADVTVGSGDGSEDAVGTELVVGDTDGAALGWSSVSVKEIE